MVQFGWACREISIDEPVSIYGQMYLRLSTGIHDPLYVTALCIDGGKEYDKVIFCSCDVTEFLGTVISQVKEQVALMQPDIPLDAIILNATHTHASCTLEDTPETTPDGLPIYSGKKYRAFFARMCAEAICEAWNTRKSGAMAYGYGYAVTGHSRRVIYHDDVSLRKFNPVAPNGHGVMYGNTNDPQFSHFEAGTDSFVNIMFTFDNVQKLTGIVINVPCPSQLSEHFYELSADYWHEVRQRVQEVYGKDVYVLPQCAAAGDLSPRILFYKEAQQRRMKLKYNLPYNLANYNQHGIDEYRKVMAERYDIAERILQAIQDVYSWAIKDIQTNIPVRHSVEQISIDRRTITDEEAKWCQDNIDAMRMQLPDPSTCSEKQYRESMSAYQSIKSRNEAAILRHQKQAENPTMHTTVHVVRIGEIAFTTTRFELFLDYMHRIQARSPFMQTFVIQLAGEEGDTYLATKRAASNKGYSASLFCNIVSPEGGQQLVDYTVKALQALAD